MMSKYFEDHTDIWDLIKDNFQINLLMRSTQMFVCILAKAITTLVRRKTVPPKMSRTWYILWYYISIIYKHIQEQCPNTEQFKIKHVNYANLVSYFYMLTIALG